MRDCLLAFLLTGPCRKHEIWRQKLDVAEPTEDGAAAAAPSPLPSQGLRRSLPCRDEANDGGETNEIFSTAQVKLGLWELAGGRVIHPSVPSHPIPRGSEIHETCNVICVHAPFAAPPSAFMTHRRSHPQPPGPPPQIYPRRRFLAHPVASRGDSTYPSLYEGRTFNPLQGDWAGLHYRIMYILWPAVSPRAPTSSIWAHFTPLGGSSGTPP